MVRGTLQREKEGSWLVTPSANDRAHEARGYTSPALDCSECKSLPPHLTPVLLLIKLVREIF